MNFQTKRKKLKQKQKELEKICKNVKRPANKIFFEACLEEVNLMMNPKIGSSKPFGIAKKF